jgi:excisionase family DNA binding protein
MPKTKKHYSAQEAAEYLGLHVESLRRLCRLGQIQHRKLKGYRFEKAWLDAFIESRTVRQVEFPDPMKVRPLPEPSVGQAITRALKVPREWRGKPRG